ncbi:zinc finger CCCH domain-containing protein 13-like [Ruditapes philippinarum]|uniref:zinc finger CCCH domain-containing protein 13-like n=1 Tax=Ruditapes philippinarum TaxID=129788 RepID=UPI00295B503D|nr:zinc finger CCCH domain-containing protein 13-like [Ruditapes philippinarum]
MDNFFYKIKESNDDKIKKMCEIKLQEGYTKYLEENINSKRYEITGGYKNFKRDIDRLKQEFDSVHRDFKDYEIMWTWHGFVQSIKETEALIIKADEDLSQKEKEEEQKRNEQRFDKMLKNQENIQAKALEKQKNDMQSHYNQLENKRDKQLKQERQKYQDLMVAKLNFEKETAQRETERFRKEQEQKQMEMMKEMEKERQRHAQQIAMCMDRMNDRDSCILS